MKEMKTTHMILTLAAVMSLGTGCVKTDDSEKAYKDLAKVTYRQSNESFANPERGWYSHKSFHSKDNPSAISVSVCSGERRMGRTLLFMLYYMEDYIDRPIAESYLQLIRTNMQVLRQGGEKCVLRFAYNDSHSELDHPWDATEAVALGHVEQLKPILQEYSDVIFCMEAGFVGTYGEWYYTDGFGFQPDTYEQWQPRRRLTDALLAALPSDRMICIRTPEAKLGMYGKTVADSVTLSNAHNGTTMARLGAHNDCFVSSQNDVGTYNSTAERRFIYNESRYTIMGGESCAVTKYCECSNALSEIQKHHLTYLNKDYHKGVIGKWRTEECYDEIDLRMGYRLILTKAFFTKNPVAGGTFRAVVKIKNGGFAAPMNPRGVELVFVADSDTSRQYAVACDDDPRFWFEGGEYTIDKSMTLPSGMTAGSYTLYLNLPDPEPTLHSSPLFSIRTANEETWNETYGYNKLTQININ